MYVIVISTKPDQLDMNIVRHEVFGPYDTPSAAVEILRKQRYRPIEGSHDTAWNHLFWSTTTAVIKEVQTL